MCNDTEVFFENEDFKVVLEYCKGNAFAHAYIYNNPIKSYKKICREFYTIVDYVKSKGFDKLLTYTQNPEFVEMLPGAVYLTSFTEGGKEYEVYKWESK